MTTNYSTNQMPRLEVKYRKALNKQQLLVLSLIYKFRFSSNAQIAKYLGKKNSKYVQKRLKILEDQGLIAKRYDKSYKLKGKPAAYYLLPKGARALAEFNDRDQNQPINVASIYKDKAVSEGFITHCTNTLSAYLALIEVYGPKLEFFTKSDLKYEQFEYYPQPLPDAHIRLQSNKGTKQFFLDIFEDSQPFFVLIRRLKQYLDYSGSGDWPNDELPTILVVVESNTAHKRLRKRIARELRDSYEEMHFATSTLPQLREGTEKQGEVWLVSNEETEDSNELASLRSL
jgi:DNA-binding MarR family transcriptional regulator